MLNFTIFTFFIISIFSFLFIFFYYKIISFKLNIFEKIQESESIREEKIHYLEICKQKYKDDIYIQEHINYFLKDSFSPLNYSINGFFIEESRFSNLIIKLDTIKIQYNDAETFDNIKIIIDKHIECLNQLKLLSIKQEKYLKNFPVKFLNILQ